MGFTLQDGECDFILYCQQSLSYSQDSAFVLPVSTWITNDKIQEINTK